MAERISSLDEGYIAGDLSVFPQAIDDRDILYETRNNAETKLKQSVSYNGKNLIVDDATIFPPKGLLRLGPRSGPGSAELIYYGKKTSSIFSDLIRGFAGSRQNQWSAQTTYVTNAVMAEHHNAVKDAILNIQEKLGTSIDPDSTSVNGRLKALEDRHLAPRPLFRAFPLRGVPQLSVAFHNFAEGHTIRFLWDFGDGSQSVERNPNHLYTEEGIYSVRLDVITSGGGRGIAVKNNYIIVNLEEATPFFYVVKNEGAGPRTFDFVDQSEGEVIQRIWIFDDGQSETVNDPDVHSTTHTYAVAKDYDPSLIIILSGQRTKRVFLSEKITVE